MGSTIGNGWLKRVSVVALIAIFGSLGAFTALGAGEEEGTSGAALNATVIEDNGGKNAWNLDEWQTFLGRTLTLTEAPELKARVSSGELPSVENRLPENPLVLLPLSETKLIGSYSDIGYVQSCVVCSGQSSGRGAEHSGSANIFPRIYESVTSSPDGTTWTFTLRKGTKWSDGMPFTTDDVRFWYEDIVLYEPFQSLWGGSGRGRLKNPSGSIALLNVIDDYTYSFSWEVANIGEAGYLQEEFATWHARHYFEGFHPNYTDSATLDAQVKEAGFSTVAEYFDDRRDWYGLFHKNPDRPNMAPWTLKVGTPSETIVFDRNPYYVGVDADGQQLPYFHEVRFDGSESARNVAVQKLRALNGDYDYVMFLSLDIYPAAKQAEIDEGNIKVTTWAGPHLIGGGQQIEFNQTTNDEDLRAIFAERDFRCGISHAINRDMIKKLNYYGMATSGPIAFPKGNPYHNPDQADECGEFNLDTANQLLDSAGLSSRDGDGNRLLPNGDKFEFTLTWRIQYESEKDAEMVVSMLNNVGVKANLRSVDGWGGLQSVRNSGEMHAYMGPMWATYATGALATASFGGFQGNQGYFAPAWGAWQASGGTEGEEPPADVKEAIKLRELIATQPDVDDRIVTMRKMTDLATKNLWAIGIVGETGTIIFGSDIHNIPTHMNDLCWRCGDQGRPANWFKQ